jgi:excisionase family DNA binding protein
MNDLKQLTPKQIAEYEVVSVNTVLNWISTGELKSKRLGHRTIRVKMSDYLEFTKKSLNER